MDLDFIITESDKAANLAQPQPAQATVADAAVVEGFEVKERKMAMSLDALISESRQGKGNRGHKGDASMGGAGGGAGPMRRQRGGPSSGGGGPRQPSVQLTVDTRGPSSYGVRFGELEVLSVHEGHLALSSGGQRTPQTLAALNAALAPFGFSVAEAPQTGEWTVSGNCTFRRFVDGLVLHGAARFAEQPQAGALAGARGGARGGRPSGPGRGALAFRPQPQGAAHIRQPQPSDRPKAQLPGQGQAQAQSSVFARLGARAAPAAQQRYNPY